MDKKTVQEVKNGLDEIWSSYAIKRDDSQDEVIDKLHSGFKKQIDYFNKLLSD